MTQPQFPYPNYPQVPYQSAAPARPTSVTVLAIIGIILAAIAVLCMPMALVPYLVQIPGPPNPMIEEMKKSPSMMAWMVGSTVAGWVLGVALLAGSIGSLLLRSWARTLMIGYAFAATVMAILGAVFNFTLMIPMTQRLAANHPGAAGVGVVLGAVVGMAFGLAFPLCILYFFTRPHVTAAFAGQQV